MTEGAQWYYVKDGSAVGPLDYPAMIAELNRQGLPPNTLVWSSPMTDWAPLNEIPVPKPPLPDVAPAVAAPPAKPGIDDGRESAVRLAGILLIVHGASWALVVLCQLFLGLGTGSPETLALSAWNTAVAVAYFFLGSGVLGKKAWAWNWGIGTSALNSIWGLYQLLCQHIMVQAFFVVLDAVVLVVLYTNKAVFQQPAKAESASGQ